MEITLVKLPVFMLEAHYYRAYVILEIWLLFMVYKVAKHIFSSFLSCQIKKKRCLVQKILKKLKVQLVVNIYSEWLIKKRIKFKQIKKKQ